ncbi:zinc finger protein DHHC domain containing protein, putative [Entamoeba invadens IP1]|uniref:Palmitoyltransferase n=1 Tax=Entamoeba invadens IP1 TaxID=370355 RepID=A0A0A1U444_ENTIV|nr:zinc finger protein DHHC domain containing protein, putative [Entamoeba invadens IP1]ELP88997.1 zinc finger protein DHHC domain containing protein, putative [Entamoeba invadens IP1]|eukprot:XP_004255768.1 zinc finger protein DHHC domain containing protein, putative [Entamoeba invadens IP1]
MTDQGVYNTQENNETGMLVGENNLAPFVNNENRHNERRRWGFNKRRRPHLTPEQVRRENLISRVAINMSIVFSFFVSTTVMIAIGIFYWEISIVCALVVYPLYIVVTVSYNRCVFEKSKLYVPLDHHVEGEPLCDVCNCTKPERAHHCSKCGRCVLKLDHHCPFVGSCIGYGNQKFFYLTLMYCFILMVCNIIISFVSITLFTIYFIQTKEINYFCICYIPTFVNFIFSMAFLAPSTPMLFQQTFRIMANISGIEKKQLQDQLRNIKDIQQTKYFLGYSRNMRSVFGNNWLLAILPVYTTLGDGMNYDFNTTQLNPI